MSFFLEKLDNKIPITLEAPRFKNMDDISKFASFFKKLSRINEINAINILQMPLGRLTMDSIVAGKLIINTLKCQVIPHISLGLENRYSFISKLLGGVSLGINNYLILGGDIKLIECLNLFDALDIIKNLKEGKVRLKNEDIYIEPVKIYPGVALIPQRRDEAIIAGKKIKEGGIFIQTQVFYDINNFKNILVNLDNKIVRYPIYVLAGVLPFLDEVIVNIFGKDFFKGIPENILNKAMKDFDHYIKYLQQHITQILSIEEKLDKIKLGIHLMPIRWYKYDLSYLADIIKYINR